jgi:hypothetical protein
MNQDINWNLGSANDTGGQPQLDPNASLSGRRSSTQGQFLESSLSSVSATPKHIFTDETQITGFGFPPAPSAGDPRNPTQSSGAYTAGNAANLKHWWRLTYDPNDESGGGDRGVDYGLDPHDFNAAHGPALGSGSQDVTAPDNAPDVMFRQRSSYPLNGSPKGMFRVDEDWSSDGDEYTVAAWIYPTSFSAGSDALTIFCIKPQHTASGETDANFLLLSLAQTTGGNSGRVTYNVHDDAGTVREIEYISDTTLTLNTWTHVAARHRLSTQECDIFIDGVKETSYTLTTFDASLVRDDDGTLDAGFGSVRAGFWDFHGNIHSIMTWDDYLSDGAIALLAGYGDGEELPAPIVLDPVESWLVFESGDNENVAREVIDFDDTTGTFTVDGDLDFDAAASDVYRLWPPNGVWSAFSNTQSVARVQKSRLLYCWNVTGSNISAFRFYVQPIDPGPLVCDIAFGEKVGSELTVLGIVDEEDEPPLSRVSNFVMGIDGHERFGRPRTYALAEFDSPVEHDQIDNNQFYPVFIKLRFKPNTEPIPLAKRCVFQVFGGNAATITTGSFMVVVDVLGADEEMILGPDRALRLKAGARVQAIIRDRATGTSIPGKTVVITQTAGPGTLNAQSGDVSDDSGLPVRRTYISPTDDPSIGMTVSFSVEVN